MIEIDIKGSLGQEKKPIVQSKRLAKRRVEAEKCCPTLCLDYEVGNENLSD
jgi:hypothetical protein